MRSTPILALLILTIVVALSPTIVQASPAVLKIISPHNDFIKQEFEWAFSNYSQTNFGEAVDIEWIDVGGTDNDVLYIRNGFAATPDSIGIDVFWGGGVDPYIALANEGLLMAYQVEAPANLSKIPSTFAGIPMYDSQYRWYGTALSGFGIMYNKVLLNQKGFPTPKTWEDLTNPKLKGWVGSASFESGSIHMAFEIMLQAYGWDKGLKVATLIGANTKSFPASSSAVPKAVSSGDVAYGLAIDFYAWAEIAKVGADKIGYVLPDKLTTINPDSIAILKGAPNLVTAKRFVSWVLTEQAQKLWMQRVGSTGGPTKNALGRMAIIQNLYSTIPAADNIVPMNPFLLQGQISYNSTKGSQRWSLVTDLLTSLIVNTHEPLADSWGDIVSTNKSLVDSGLFSPRITEAVNKLTEVPITEAAALTLSTSWSSATLRNQYISQWNTFAIKRYSDASSLAISATVETVGSIKTQAQNNLYYGLAGGTALGVVVGAIVMMFMGRRREISALKK